MKILIIGENSYIGRSFKEAADSKYSITMAGSSDGAWRGVKFARYDIVLHCAGIVHVEQKNRTAGLYEAVNCDLAVEVAKRSVSEGVKQFIFLSSMAVYGNKCSEISHNTIPKPNIGDFYGSSKLKAEQELQNFANQIRLCIVRPPMIYGRGCKGNFPKLVKLACTTPIFPDFSNRRSMLYIENLCTYLCALIDSTEAEGVFLPQNSEYVNTTELVTMIARCYNKRIATTRLFNPLIKTTMNIIPNIRKLFGDLIYDNSKGRDPFADAVDYISFEESVRRSVFMKNGQISN